jgi:hypothetical protein
MASPITGPFGESADVDTINKYFYVRWSRQRKPYNVVLPYDLRDCDVIGDSGTWNKVRPSTVASWLFGYLGSGIPQVDNIAYSKLIGKLHGTHADFGIVLGEHHSARKMITARTQTLVTIAKFLQTRNGPGLYHYLRAQPRTRPPKSFKVDIPTASAKGAKGIAGLWLEWSWGWRPAYEDIVNALNTLVEPVLVDYVRSRHTARFSLRAEDAYSPRTGTGFGEFYTSRSSRVYNFDYTVANGCRFSVTNPNVALASRLGVLNLPKVLWSVTAFSFLVDKYVNIGQLLGSVTDLSGYQMMSTWTSRKIQGTHTEDGYLLKEYDQTVWPGEPSVQVTKNQVQSYLLKARGEGLLRPVLTYRRPSVGSLGEAASHISLLVQILLKNK